MKLVPIERDGTTGTSAALPPEGADVLQAVAALYQLVGFHPPWICYIAMEGGVAAGTCGFKAPPSQGRAELAYFTFPAFEGRGVATRMVGELLVLARTADPAIEVLAQTLTERNASHRVLEKHGFACIGTVEHAEDGKVLEWRKAPS